ncbi:MAG: hypothetical protein LBC77_05915 [Spirochaetaceae bacterium]|jgi:hypothetical protein|nr:hypothetical protein [Spirochaetaceae bacterium]
MKFIHFTYEGRAVCGFDSGCGAAVFARMRGTALLGAEGLVLRRGGHDTPFQLEVWRPEGVVERDGTIIIFGAEFAGVSLGEALCFSREAALAALKIVYTAALFALEAGGASGSAAPRIAKQGVFLNTGCGDVFFPPFELVKDGLVAEGFYAGAARAKAELNRGAAALLYEIYSGGAKAEDGLPLYLAAPGIDGAAADEIENALAEGGAALGERAFRAHFTKPDGAEAERLAKEREAFIKKRKRQGLHSKILENKRLWALSAGVCVLAAALILSFSGGRPTTRGLGAGEVVEKYYAAFAALDTAWMDACLARGAGGDDIKTSSVLVAAQRMAESYGESRRNPLRIDGLTVLDSRFFDEAEGKPDSAVFSVKYTISLEVGEEGVEEASRIDTLVLEKRRGLWRIAKIERE